MKRLVSASHASLNLHARRSSRREQGVALVLVLTVITVITVFVAELTSNTTTAFQVAVNERDRLRA
jgi:type II secretory pathway component PulK